MKSVDVNVSEASRLHRTVLVAVAQPSTRELLSASLQRAGLFALAAGSADEGLRFASEVRPDLIVVDLDSPEMLGLFRRASASLQAEGLSLPSLMLASDLATACGSVGEVCGGTFCLAKPFSPGEVIDLISLHLLAPSMRPGGSKGRATLRVGAFELDVEGLTVILHRYGRPRRLDVAPVEMRLLQCLLEEADSIVSREEIRTRVWGSDTQMDVRTVDQNIKRLRSCLAELGAGDVIKTARGRGYLLASNPFLYSEPG